MQLNSKTLVYPTPPGATSAYEYTYYGKATGLDKVRLRYLDVADDIFDGGTLAFSTDNGATWGAERPHGGAVETARGTLRSFAGLNSLEGMSQYYLKYRVSADGGRTSLVDERVIQRGDFTPEHPCEHVWIGRNCMTMPANQSMVRTAQGHLAVCISISILGVDGELYNPGGGFTWLQELILLGHWREDGSGRIDWDCGPRIAIAPDLSTRGLDESTMALMPDGRLLLVMRGSNGGAKDPEGTIPGRKWYAISGDGGFTWSEPAPWRYHDGELFYSPASMCVIVRHSNGNYYWFGNIVPENPLANHPRTPLVCAQIDPVSCLLRRETLFTVDDRQPDDHAQLQFSNFNAHEDRITGELIVDMPRFEPAGESWTGDTYRYRVGV